VGVFRDGAAHHGYWMYWVTLPLAVGLAAGIADARGFLPRTSLVSGAPTRFALLVGAVAVGAAGLSAPSVDRRALTQGYAAGRVVARTHYPPQQTRAWYLGDIIGETDWLPYLSHRPPQRLLRPVDVDRLAAEHPHDLVFVSSYRLTSDLMPAPGAPCRAGVPLKVRYAEMSAAALAAALRGGRCPASRA
jgi:hypothetical protein